MRTRQSGIGLYGWIFVIVVVGLGATLFIRLMPYYLNDRTLGTQLESLIDNEDLSKMSRRQVRESMQRRMRINSLNMDLREIMTLEREGKVTTVVLDYEVREHIMSNIDVVLSFHHEGVDGS